MQEKLPKMMSSVSYNSEKPSPERAVFDFTVTEDTLLYGYMKLHLWVAAKEADDLDLFVAIKKMDAEGNWIPVYVLGKPHPGAPGRMRVSFRELDEEKTTDFQPYHTFANPQKLGLGEIVPVDVEIFPYCRIWHPGEKIRVEVMGWYERFDWFEPFDYNTVNKGEHIIYTGGNYDSYLQIPSVSMEELEGDC